MLKQKTLKDSFSLSGKGLHTGLDLTVTFNPAPDNHGYKIQRIDLEGQPTIDAVADNVTETTRGTVLSKNGVKVSTVEHGMAALYALGIDNCLIQVNGPEFPILDGSAQYYVQEIERVGTEEQSAVKDFYIIKSKIEFRDESTGSSIIVLPDENFSLNVLVSYDSTIIPNQFATLEDMHNFKDEVAASRTFVFVREIEPLLSAGLIKGGDLDNAIVIYERKMSQESYDKLADVMGVPHMDADQLGYINHKPLVWPNECARHKLLDVIGDLALIGKPIKGRIIATRPGHTINNKFARQMRKEIRLHEIQAPTYDCNREPVMDVNRIRELLPHRYPFQLVDKVIEMGASYIVGIKNITANEPFFQGHFPQEPVMPGVLQIEAMAQVGGLLVLNSVDEPERYSTYFMKIDGVKFRQKVVPGDTLLFRVELLAPIRRGISTMKGYAFVGEKVVCEAEFMAQIVKINKTKNMVSPLAYIHPEAKIGENVEIAPFVFIDKNVVIGDNNKIMANVNILYGSRIGNGNTIFPGAVIGAVPQDLKFRGEESTAEIGDNNLIRENVTVNRGTAAKGRTIVGSNNLLMEGVHVAHDALIGNGCIIGNSTKMAGEIVIDDNAIISANVLMHQFCHVGSHVMIQGGCRFSKDIPPYIIAGREPIAFSGINIIGLRRRGFANEVIESIHNAYRIIYQSGLNTTDALKKLKMKLRRVRRLTISSISSVIQNVVLLNKQFKIVIL